MHQIHIQLYTFKENANTKAARVWWPSGGSSSKGKAGLEHFYKGSLAAKGSTLHVSMYGDILRKYEKSFVKTDRTPSTLKWQKARRQMPASARSSYWSAPCMHCRSNRRSLGRRAKKCFKILAWSCAGRGTSRYAKLYGPASCKTLAYGIATLIKRGIHTPA